MHPLSNSGVHSITLLCCAVRCSGLLCGFLLLPQLLLGLLQDLAVVLGGELASSNLANISGRRRWCVVAFLLPPVVHVAVVAGQQHRRDSPAVPHLRAGILGIFQQSVPVALIGVAALLRQNAGNHAAQTVRHSHGGDLAAGEDEVADGEA